MQLNDTISLYQQGNKTGAFRFFLSDPTANQNVSFDAFCRGMEKILANRAARVESENAHSEVVRSW